MYSIDTVRIMHKEQLRYINIGIDDDIDIDDINIDID